MDAVRNDMRSQKHTIQTIGCVLLPFTCITRSWIQWISGKSERSISFKFFDIDAVIGPL